MGDLAFWVVAPPAAQRAAFQEDGGTNAGAIVDGVSLNVENNACLHGWLINNNILIIYWKSFVFQPPAG
jgi:hypothetical protein